MQGTIGLEDWPRGMQSLASLKPGQQLQQSSDYCWVSPTPDSLGAISPSSSMALASEVDIEPLAIALVSVLIEVSAVVLVAVSEVLVQAVAHMTAPATTK